MQDRVIMDRPAARASATGVVKAWRAVGWFGSVLAFVGFVDVALVWYPLNVGNAAWEFAVVGQSFSSLPLLTMGLAALLASALAVGGRVRLRLIGGFMLALAAALIGAFLLYLLSVPVALRMAPAEVLPGVHKAIIKTALFALAFPTVYIAASITAFRHSGVRKAM